MFKRTKDAASAAGKKVLGYSCREGDKFKRELYSDKLRSLVPGPGLNEYLLYFLVRALDKWTTVQPAATS